MRVCVCVCACSHACECVSVCLHACVSVCMQCVESVDSGEVHVCACTHAYPECFCPGLGLHVLVNLVEVL